MNLRDALVNNGLDDNIKQGNRLKGTLGNATEEGLYVNVDNPDIYIDISRDVEGGMVFTGHINGESTVLFSEYGTDNKNAMNKFIKEHFQNDGFIEWTDEIDSIIPFDLLSDSMTVEDSVIEYGIEDVDYGDIEPLTEEEADVLEQQNMEADPDVLEADTAEPHTISEEESVILEEHPVEEVIYQDDEEDVPPPDDIDIELNEKEDEPEADAAPYQTHSSLIETEEKYMSMVDAGYIPPVLQNELSGHIQDIREQSPDFGKMIGGIVDTSSSYHFSNKDLPIGKLKEFFTDEAKEMKFEYLRVHQSSRVDEGFSAKFSENIGGTKMYGIYSPVSVVTFEYRLKGEDTNRFDIYATNDLGTVYTRLDSISDKEHVLIGEKTLPFLDRTSIDSPRAFKFIKEAGENGINPDSLDKLKEKLSEQNDELIEKISDKISDNLSSIEPEYRSLLREMSDTEDKIGTCLENSDYLKAVSDETLLKKIAEIDTIKGKIVDKITEIGNYEKGSGQHVSLLGDLDKLKSQYQEKLDEIKADAEAPERKEILSAREDNRESFEAASSIRQDFEEKYDSLYQDGELRLSDVDGIPRFIELVSKEIVSYPSVKTIPAINDSVSEKAIEMKQNFVDKWNHTDGHEKMQLHLKTDTGEIYTEYGTRVDMRSADADTTDENGRADYKVSFKESECAYSKDDMAKMGFAETEKGFDTKSESYQEFLSYKVGEISIGDIGKEVYREIRNDRDSKDISTLKSDIEHIDSRLGNALELANLHDIDEAREIIDSSRENDIDSESDEDKSSNDDASKGAENIVFKSGNPIADSPKTKYISKIGNVDAKVEISDRKMSQLNNKSDIAKARAINEITGKLEGIKEKIVACDRILASFDGRTEYFLTNSPVYQFTYGKMCDYVLEYKDAGGKIGNDCFIKSDVSFSEKLASNINYLTALNNNGIGGIVGLVVTAVRVEHAFAKDMGRFEKEAVVSKPDVEKISIKDRISSLIDKVASVTSEIVYDDMELVNEDFENELPEESMDAGTDTEDVSHNDEDPVENGTDVDFNEDIDTSKEDFMDDEDFIEDDSITNDPQSEDMDEIETESDGTNEHGRENGIEEGPDDKADSADKPEQNVVMEDASEEVIDTGDNTEDITDSEDNPVDMTDESENNMASEDEDSTPDTENIESEENMQSPGHTDNETEAPDKESKEKTTDAVAGEETDSLIETEADKSETDIADEIRDSLDGDKEDFEKAVDDAVSSDELSPLEVVDTFSDIMSDYIDNMLGSADETGASDRENLSLDDIYDVADKINTFADKLSDEVGIDADSIREALHDNLAENGIGTDLIEDIQGAEAHISMDAEPQSIENLNYGDLDINDLQTIQTQLENGESLENQIDMMQNDIEKELSDPEISNEMDSGIKMSEIADEIKNDIAERVDIPMNEINDVVEQSIAQDVKLFDEPDFEAEQYIEAKTDDLCTQIDNMETDPIENQNVDFDQNDDFSTEDTIDLSKL